MELLESILILNTRLKDHYGAADDGSPMWRIVWSENQFEKRVMEYSDKGIKLLISEVREVPKYRQWIQEKYVLERLVAVPDANSLELTTKTSYEPIFVFEDKNFGYLPPKWEVTQFVIDCVYSAMGKSNLAKYKPSEKEQNDAVGQELRVKELEAQLFGNETDVTDALAHKQGIVVPSNYKVN